MRGIRFVYPAYLLNERGGAKKKLLCDKKSISSAEFFAADKAGGIKPKHCVRVRSFEYQNEKLMELEGVLYNIYRTYSTDEGITELYLSPRAGNNGKEAL